MKTSTKFRLAVLICAVYMVWPLIHRWVVAAWDMNPWRFGGFAMYATPPAMHTMTITEVREDRRAIVPDGDLPAKFQERKLRYLIRRGVLGRLLPPNATAKAYFDVRPGMSHIEVSMARDVLDATSARIKRSETIYKYDRKRFEP
ncbi:MAG: hypothetical protein CMJ18_22575 [Phycisphaeraceae bacterium]|nr:hypothetical protein [Phycisphaeraceae bacterium]